MNEMVARVAKAIDDQMASDDNMPEDIARAAIAAMCEPTKEMLESAWANALAEDAKGVWQDMIDEILRRDV